MVGSVVVARAMDRDLQRQAGLALAEHHLLAIINEAGEQGIRPTDLALGSTLTKSGLTRAVDRLEALGLIGSRVCPRTRAASFSRSPQRDARSYDAQRPSSFARSGNISQII